MRKINEEIFLFYKQYQSAVDKCIKERHDKAIDDIFLPTVPMFYKDFDNPSQKVLFVGINPSLTVKMIEDFKRIHGDNTELLNFNNLTKNNFDDVTEKLIEFQEALKGRNNCLKTNYGIKQIPYFKKIDTVLGKACPHREWESYDLFSYRLTLQARMAGLFGIRNIRDNPLLKEYLDKSIVRLKRVVEIGAFKFVVVANAQVSKWLKESQIFEYMDDRIIYFRYLGNGCPGRDLDRLVKQIQEMDERYEHLKK